jgi:hypothetical protein
MSSSDEHTPRAGAALSKRDEIRLIDERIDSLLEEARSSQRELSAILDEWRAEGVLPPKKQRPAF